MRFLKPIIIQDILVYKIYSGTTKNETIFLKRKFNCKSTKKIKDDDSNTVILYCSDLMTNIKNEITVMAIKML